MRRSSIPADRWLAVVAAIPLAVVACGESTSTPTATSSSAITSSSGGGGIPILRGYYEYAFGSPTTFATKSQLETDLQFAYGIPDGSLGAIDNDGTYTFFGSGARNPCTRTGCADEGVFSMTGSLTALTQTSPGPTAPLFGPGAAEAGGASGWIFDQDYAGGGQVFPYSASRLEITLHGATEVTYSGLLMPYHGEYHYGPTCGSVPCYYAGIGLAVGSSTGSTFGSVGQILQIYPPVSYYSGSNQNVGNSYGSLVLADENGNHLSNPPPAGSNAYFYLFYQDVDPNAPGDGNPSICQYSCLAVARASYASVIAAVIPPEFIDILDPPNEAATVAGLFTKYYVDAGTPTWTQPATSNAAESGWSGQFTALMSDVTATMVSVIYDSVSGEYLAAFMASPVADNTFDNEGICIRTSPDLIHWSPTSTPGTTPACAAFYQTPKSGTTNHTDIYTSFIGEGGDPLTGGSAPLVFFQEFDAYDNDAGSDSFPNPWSTSHVALKSIPVNVTYHLL
jgi:hypothetical protein